MRRFAIAIALLLSSIGVANASTPRWELQYAKHVMFTCDFYLSDPASGHGIIWPYGDELCRKMTDNIQARLEGSTRVNGPVHALDCMRTPGCSEQADVLLIRFNVVVPPQIEGLDTKGFFVGYIQISEKYRNSSPGKLVVPSLDAVYPFGGTDLHAYLASAAFEKFAFSRLELFMHSFDAWTYSDREEKKRLQKSK